MNASTRYRFGEFCLIPSRRELWRADQLLTVQPKVLDALTYLIEHRDRAVGYDELISAVWGRVDVTDNVLGQIIGRARRIVGDSGEAQQAIRTVPRFGFRWLPEVAVSTIDAGARVESAGAPADTPLAHPQPRTAPRRRPARVGALALAVGASGVVVAALAFFAGGSQSPLGDGAVTAPNAPPLVQLRAALAADRLETARSVLAALPDADRLLPEIRYEEATLALKEGRADGALTAFTTLLADIEGRGNALLAGKTAHGAGQAAFRLGDFDQAQRYYEQAIAALGPGADTDVETRAALGRVWNGLGGRFVATLDFEHAERAFAQARIALEAANDPAALARLESNVALMLAWQYRQAEAIPRLEAAAELSARAGDASGEVGATMNLATTHLALLQPAAALAVEPRLRALRERIGDPVEAAHIDLLRARVLLANGRLREADVLLHALGGRPTPADLTLMAVRELVASELDFERAAWEAGSSRIRSALASDWNTPDNSMAAIARWRLLTARQRVGDAQGVADVAVEAEVQAHAFPDDATIGLYAALAQGAAAAAEGDDASARSGFESALAQAEANRMPFDLIQVITAYAQFLVRQGDMEAAGRLANRIAHWADQDYTAALVQLGVYHATDADAWRTSLARARRLAGERTIPDALAKPPTQYGAAKGIDLAAVNRW